MEKKPVVNSGFFSGLSIISDFSGFPSWTLGWLETINDPFGVNVRLPGVFVLGWAGDVFRVQKCTLNPEHPHWPLLGTVAVDRMLILIKGNRSNIWWRTSSVTPPSPLHTSPLAWAFILNDLTCGKSHQVKLSLINSARWDPIYFWFCSANRKLADVEEGTSVEAHGPISIWAVLLNGKNKPSPISHFLFFRQNTCFPHLWDWLKSTSKSIHATKIMLSPHFYVGKSRSFGICDWLKSELRLV